MSDDVHALGGLYSLDALDDLDRQRFERHAAECSECQREVAEFRQTIGRIAATDAEPAPLEMRDNVLQRIAETPQQVPRHIAAVPAGPPAPRRWMAMGVWAAASLVLIAALGFALVRSRADLSDSRDLVTALGDPKALSSTFTGDDGTVARIVAASDNSSLVVLLGGLKPVAADRAYALWLIGDQGPSPMGLVRPGADGSARLVVNRQLDQFSTFGITEEPASGSLAPTTPILVSGALHTE